jgi:hypothetical protein
MLDMLNERQKDLVRSAIIYHGIFKNELASAAKAGEGSEAWKHFEARRDGFLKQLGIDSLYTNEEI